jgi:hypothetical protein
VIEYDNELPLLSQVLNVLVVLSVLAYSLFVLCGGVKAADVREACKDDYMNFCAHTAPFSPECKSCMRSHASHLSFPCAKAINAAGMASSADKAMYLKHKK